MSHPTDNNFNYNNYSNYSSGNTNVYFQTLKAKHKNTEENDENVENINHNDISNTSPSLSNYNNSGGPNTSSVVIPLDSLNNISHISPNPTSPSIINQSSILSETNYLDGTNKSLHTIKSGCTAESTQSKKKIAQEAGFNIRTPHALPAVQNLSVNTSSTTIPTPPVHTTSPSANSNSNNNLHYQFNLTSPIQPPTSTSPTPTTTTTSVSISDVNAGGSSTEGDKAHLNWQAIPSSNDQGFGHRVHTLSRPERQTMHRRTIIREDRQLPPVARTGATTAINDFEDAKPITAEEKKSFWVYFSRICTFWALPSCMNMCGLRDKQVQQAWREKVRFKK